MTVLADLLEVTDTCIGSLVQETREVLEDHGYSPTIASMRFATARDLLAFLDQDLRPPGPRSSTPCPTRPSPA